MDDNSLTAVLIAGVVLLLIAGAAVGAYLYTNMFNKEPASLTTSNSTSNVTVYNQSSNKQPKTTVINKPSQTSNKQPKTTVTNKPSQTSNTQPEAGYCPNCGHFPWHKKTRCLNCGYGDNDGILYCPNCKSYTFYGNSWNNGYCTSCGYYS
jgi:ribosomal protein L37E